MTLRLTVLSYAGRTPATSIAATFGEDGGVVGRQPGCDWVLDDPEGHVSKRHCRIDFVAGRYRVTDTSTNGVFLNDGAGKVGFGASAALSDGDHLYIGGYDIVVRLVATGVPTRTAIEKDVSFGIGGHRKPAPAPSAALNGSYFDAGPLTTREPPESLPGSEEWRRSPTPDHAPIEQSAFRPPPAVSVPAPANGAFPAGELLPSGWNPLDDDDEQSPLSGLASSAVSTPGSVSTTIPAATPRPSATPSSSADEPIIVERAAPRIVRGVTGDSSTMDLVQAFLEGAGLGTEVFDQADPEAVLHAAGQRLRELVSGMRALLELRTRIKTQLRVEQAPVSATDNNPLKLSVTDDDALTALLLPQRQGYLAPDVAIRRSFQDLTAHELALMAGARSAVAEALAPLAPETLMRRVEGRSLLAASKKAKYWDLFEAEFNKLREAGEDDPQGRLAQLLASAYESQQSSL
jgi:type VI secretion system FHA domain protein